MRPLAGIRVVEAASYLTGPFAALNLADLGADVVKVEPPRGDPMRRFGIRFHGDGTGMSFANLNRNKTEVTIDLKSAAGLDALRQLLADADIFITNWRPAVAARLGLADLGEQYPRLIWVRVSGYGQDGPLAEFPAFDSIVQARTGIVAHNGETPTLVPGYLADKVTGMFAAQAALAALAHREATGEGAVIDVSMLDAMTYFAAPDLLAGHLVVDAPERTVTRHLAAARPLPTSDGWLVISPVSGRQLKGALAAMGHPEWHEQLLASSSPTEMVELLYRLAEGVLPTRSSDEWERAFRSVDVPVSPVMDLDAHLADSQVIHNGIYHETEEPEFGHVRHPRYVALFASGPVETDDLPVPPLAPLEPT